MANRETYYFWTNSIANNLLDFQNYILLETGYPFAFYDYEKLISKLKNSEFHLSISKAEN